MIDLTKSYDFFQPEKCKERIHIIGCGSVGATVAEQLARLGLTKFTLWDFDKVEPRNLANQLFRQQDVGRLKTEATADIMAEINPDIKENLKLMSEGWKGQKLNGIVFLAVDNIDLRREIATMHLDNPYVKAMFDFRTSLTFAQHFAVDWSDYKAKQNFINTMAFTHEEAELETPMSACRVTLSVCPTLRVICAYGVANFMNFYNGKGLKTMIVADAFDFDLVAV